MAYELHIEIPEEEVEIDEWIEAIELIENIKIDSSDNEITNPLTGETVTFPGNEGDVAVNIDGNWIKCIGFRRGRGSFNARPEIEAPSNPVRNAAAMIAKTLGAQIVGGEGEVYNW